ncbi:hypothetical protein F4805DRAFT_249021 [Annulohypoxylon moriforme]|nr:hypothetical protein F4805DRAFT_249021 [Annulohypoxylon moriforme]
MARSFRSAVVALYLWSITVVNGEDGVNKFLYPVEGSVADDQQWHYRDTIITSYEGNISAPLLYTFCKDDQGDVSQERLDHVNGPNTTASIILDFIVDSPVTSCWFNIRLDEPGSSVGANSASFPYNSTEGERKTFSLAPTSTSASSSPTASSTQSGVITTTTPADASTSAEAPYASGPRPGHGPGLSPVASAGVGVGVGLVGAAIGAGAVAFLYRRRRNKKRGAGAGAGPGDDSAPMKPEPMGLSQYPPSIVDSEYSKSVYNCAQAPNNEIHEAPAHQDGAFKSELDSKPVVARHEMDATSVVYELA